MMNTVETVVVLSALVGLVGLLGGCGSQKSGDAVDGPMVKAVKEEFRVLREECESGDDDACQFFKVFLGMSQSFAESPRMKRAKNADLDGQELEPVGHAKHLIELAIRCNKENDGKACFNVDKILYRTNGSTVFSNEGGSFGFGNDSNRAMKLRAPWLKRGCELDTIEACELLARTYSRLTTQGPRDRHFQPMCHYSNRVCGLGGDCGRWNKRCKPHLE